MERVRPPRASDEAVPETIGPLPSTHALPVLLSALRSPGVVTDDVDTLLRGLACPVSEDETPRARADLLLELIEAADVAHLQGSNGLTVRAAAVRALLDLGYPYALEIPPEALEEAHRAQQIVPGFRIPIPGLIATLAGFIAQSAPNLPMMFSAIERDNDPIAWLFLGALMGPTCMAVVGGLLQKSGLLKTGLVTMALTSVFWLFKLPHELLDHPFPLSRSATYTALVAGLGFLLGTFLLRPSAWRPEEEPPQADEPPPTP